MRRIGIGWVGLVLLGWAGAAHADLTKIDGRVVDAAGKPIAGVQVGSFWFFEGGKPRPYDGVPTDAEGRFRVEHDFYNRPGLVMTLDADGKTGGLIIIDPGKLTGPVEIAAGPLVRVHGRYTCQDSGKPAGWTNSFVMSGPTNIKVAQCMNDDATFDLRLPPGEYLFNAYGDDKIQGIGRKLDLKADQPDLDLGTIDLKMSPLGKMYGKEPPPLTITDARGIGRDIKLSDFRGKWVVLEFWGFGCGPCVGKSLPDLMQIWDEHPDERDGIVVLAVHDPHAENFAQLDEKLVPIVRDTWGGRELPFPTLLDSTGKTIADYGINSFPTTVLIGPHGRVMRGGEHYLRMALPHVPMARRIPIALDRMIPFGQRHGARLALFAQELGETAQIPIRLDEPALKTAGVALDTLIPLDLSAQLSLRSWLDLGLRPLGLVAVPGPAGLVVTTLSPGSPTAEPSPHQARVRDRITQKFAETKVSFDFAARPLAELTAALEERAGVPFVLDPADRLAGRLDPRATVTGRATDAPLGEALKSLLGPLGIEAVVRDEVVILTRPGQP